MTALQKYKSVTKDISLIYDLTEKPNKSNLKALDDRAIITKLTAELLLPTNKILSVEIDFDATSGYHNNSLVVMNDFGVEMLATAFESQYGKAYADQIRQAWAQKQQPEDPRKPSYLLVQQPSSPTELPQVFAVCGKEQHPPKDAPESIIK
jgi:hypothetical protein